MKIVYKTNDVNEAHNICQLLENKGIPSQVRENGLTNRGSHIPNGNEVWIYLNEQHTDAVKLINDPNHNVANSLDIEEFYSNLNNQAALYSVNEQMLKFVKYGSVVVLCVILAVFIFIKLKT